MKIKTITKLIIIGFFLIAGSVKSAFAGDGATIVFREGHVAYIENGYQALVDAYKKLNDKATDYNIIELKLESSPFLINLSDVVIVCRDKCTSLNVTDPRKSEPKR